MKALPLLLCLSALAVPVFTLAATGMSASADRAVAREVYKLRVGDRVAVEIKGIPEPRTEGAVIDADGKVTLPGLPAPVRVAGLTVAEAQIALMSQHRQHGFVAEPKVWIGILSYAQRNVAPKVSAPRGEAPRATEANR